MHFALPYKINVQNLPAKGIIFTFEATKEECLCLADNHHLIAVNSFFAEYNLYRWKRDAIKMRGFFRADIIQRCVVSFSPVKTQIQQDIDLVFAPCGSKLLKEDYIKGAAELLLDVNGPDRPELYTGNVIEVGAVTEEMFELALDPYPRCEGAQFSLQAQSLEENLPLTSEEDTPFLVLKERKRN